MKGIIASLQPKLMFFLIFKIFLSQYLSRSLVVAIAMMFGRLGALSGNMLFPVFMEMGCIQPFLMVGGVLLGKIYFRYFS